MYTVYQCVYIIITEYTRTWIGGINGFTHVGVCVCKIVEELSLNCV
jgi:hypothetical protein